ncbi:hypothetical protein [Tomitella biformata]|uniref:hypothetical protein n=1 Tax=Tomitella biformata TaxID=630403 RepID=UPI0004650058|nr:hypothetical protein [Tomitella biformata]
MNSPHARLHGIASGRARRVAVAAAIPLFAATAAIATSTTAAAASPDSLSIDGSLQPVPGFSVLHIVADGQKAANGDTTGTYNANVELGGLALPIEVAGPITCLSFDGDTASLIYPIASTVPPVVTGSLSGALAVQITVTRGIDGQPSHVGLMGPMPTSSFEGCEPGPTPFVFDGTIEIGGG